jgi:hypothetical protein
MAKISAMQIDEILDERWAVLIRRDAVHEGRFVVQTIQDDGRALDTLVVDRAGGPDIGELVDELHSRL